MKYKKNSNYFQKNYTKYYKKILQIDDKYIKEKLNRHLVSIVNRKA